VDILFQGLSEFTATKGQLC